MIRAAIIFILCCVLPQAIGLPGIPQAGTERLLFEKPENFQKNIAWDNSAPPVWHDVTVTSSQGGSKTGKVTIPAASEIFAYDLDGNLTSDGLWTYTWDAANRLKEMTSSTALPSAARKKVEFKYDFLGRRVKKAVSTWNGSGWTLSSDTLFIYDGWNLIAEVNALNNGLLRSYMWGLEIDGSLGEAGGVGGLLKVTDHSGGTDHFAGYDGNGNVVLLVNASGGVITAQYEYSPFGELIRSTGSFAEANPVRFSTKYQDRESDQLYYGYRCLNPSTARWLNRDPLGEGGGLNLYAFVENSCVSGFDALGLSSKTLTETTVAGGTAAGLDMAGGAAVSVGKATAKRILVNSIAVNAAVFMSVFPTGAILEDDDDPIDTFVVRGGLATPENLQTGSSKNDRDPLNEAFGFSVQSRPGATIEELARHGMIRNTMLSISTVNTLLALGQIIGFDIQVVKTPGLGANHATVTVPNPFALDVAKKYSGAFGMKMPNPYPYKP